MSTSQALKVLHDQLLAQQPADATHDPENCPLCAQENPDDQAQTPGGSMQDVFTQDDLDAAIAAASADLTERLRELEGQVQETEVGKAVAAAIAPKDASITELQNKLDAAEAARTAAESKLTETQQFWSDAIAQHEQAAALAARRDARVTAATEAGVFSEQYITDNADRFAAMDDADFADRLEEWRLIAGDTKTDANKIPAATALHASRAEETSDDGALKFIGEMKTRGQDPRLVGGMS